MGITIVLFSKKRSSIPLLMSIFFGLSLVYNFAFWFLGIKGFYGFATNSDFFTDVLPSLIWAIIFIPYFFFSEGASDTFTKRLYAESTYNK